MDLRTGHDRKWLFLLLPVLAVVGALTLSYLWNEDFFWYLTSGQQILEQGRIPSDDPFLYTSWPGIGWVYHSWLWTVLVALVDRLAGLGGVVVFHALLAVALTVLVYTTRRVDRLGLVNALAVTLFLVMIGDRLCGKAEVGTWLMLALFFRLLDRPEAFTWKRGAALGALQVLWANLHGGYPLGIFVALCYSLGGWIEDRFLARPGEAERATARPPVWFPALLFLLALADPWLWRERLAPFAFATGSGTVQPVGASGNLLVLEWRSPFHPGLTDTHLPWLYLLAVAAGLASFVAARRWPLPRLLFLLGMAALAATAARHLPGLGLAAALVILGNLGDKRAREERGEAATVAPPAKKDRKDRHKGGQGAGAPVRQRPRWLYPAACGLLALGLLGAAVALRVARSGFEGGQSSDHFFAVRPAVACPRAAGFILERGLPGPIFNDFQMGAYLSHRLYPHHKLFVDGRVLDPKLVARYTEMVESPARWREAEKQYGFRTAVLGNYSGTVRSPLGRTILQDPRWRLAYVDPLAVIFVKDGPAEPVVHPGLPNGEVPFVEPPGYAGLLGALHKPFLGDFPSNYLVEYLANLGQVGRTRELVDLSTQALQAMPEQPLLYRQRCAGHLALREAREAVGDCETAYRLRPEDPQIIALYSAALSSAGRRREAVLLVERALRDHPQDPMLRSVLTSLKGSGRPG